MANPTLIASNAIAKRTPIAPSLTAKVPFIAPNPQLPSTGAEVNQLEQRSVALPQMPLQLAASINGTLADAQDDDQNIDDNRSSSLSDVGDAADDNEPYAGLRNLSRGSDGTDSEAETERLEQSPQRVRKHMFLKDDEPRIQKEYSNPGTEISKGETEGEVGPAAVPQIVQEKHSPAAVAPSGEEIATELVATSLGDYSTGVVSPPSIAGTKRKRTSSRSRSPSENPELEPFARKQKGSIKSKSELDSNPAISDHAHDQSALTTNNVSLEARSWTEAGEAAAHGVEELTSEIVPPEDDTSRTKRSVKGKKGRRKGKKPRTDESGDVECADPIEDESAQIEQTPIDFVAENLEAVEGIGDAEGEEEGAEATLRSEEELKKNLALDALTAIEKQFATFKDKLYDDRLAQLNNELELLNQPNPTHPEYLAMMQCIDARLREKINHEQTLLSYKIRALEVKSVAERSQLHSQYFQDVREIREKTLEKVGEQWYQIQRDRRGWDGSVPDLMYKFPTRRSVQITQQTAYNMEVSILSGVAKHVGFPAAPSIEGARTTEIEEDLKSIGIKPSLRTALHHHPPPLSTAISGVPLTNSIPAAEEQFLEQTPWANPQHPAHHHLQQVQKQIPRQPRINSPSSASFGQRRVMNPNPRNEVSAAISTAIGTVSTRVPISSDVQSLVRSNEVQPRDSTEWDPVGTLSKYPSGILFYLSVTYAAAQMQTEAPLMLSSGSIDAPRQAQPSAISPGLSSIAGNATTSNSQGFTPRTSTLEAL
ncbi:MAG: hypothetical protein M1812_001522 [Candelaria pacifica]|nr:MAG: hypothetical protein M1812_001522 [Candelaria pacifica]